MTVLPLRRTERLVVRQLAGETLVYDLDTNDVHALTPEVACVWEACDGTAGIDAVLSGCGLELPVAEQALGLLADKGLVVDAVTRAGLSRRDLLRRTAMVGAAVAAAPLLSTLPAAAQTGCATTNPGAQPGTLKDLCTSYRDFAAENRSDISSPSGAVGGAECRGYSFFEKTTNQASWGGWPTNPLPFYFAGTDVTGDDARFQGPSSGQGANVNPVTIGQAIPGEELCAGGEEALPNAETATYTTDAPFIPAEFQTGCALRVDANQNKNAIVQYVPTTEADCFYFVIAYPLCADEDDPVRVLIGPKRQADNVSETTDPLVNQILNPGESICGKIQLNPGPDPVNNPRSILLALGSVTANQEPGPVYVQIVPDDCSPDVVTDTADITLNCATIAAA